MELIPVYKGNNQPLNNITVEKELPISSSIILPQQTIKEEFKQNPFIEANTKEVSLSCFKNDCIIPVFAKDNERTISHQEFIEITQDCVNSVFPNHNIESPEIRVSHQIKGRTPEAIHKSAKELFDNEKTQYFERMAFIMRIPSIKESVNGNFISLVVGGVRAYNRENLYSKKSFEKFQVFIGFQNMVCCNLCVSTDGFKSEIRASNYIELKEQILQLIQSYQAEKHFNSLRNLTNYHLTENQFAQLIGRAKLYQFLPKGEKLQIPPLQLNDGQISTIAKDFYQDERFCKNENGNINLWNVYNLFTSANKSSYIDTFLDRNVNAFDFTNSISKAINGNSYHWFLS